MKALPEECFMPLYISQELLSEEERSFIRKPPNRPEMLWGNKKPNLCASTKMETNCKAEGGCVVKKAYRVLKDREGQCG